MVIERTENEVIFRVPADIDISFLQSISDILSYKELTKNIEVSQSEVDSLVSEIKIDRWKRRKSLLIK